MNSDELALLEYVPYLIPTSQQAQRLFHGRGHAYSGYEYIAIDWLAPVILITLYKDVERDDLEKLAQQLFDKFADCSSVQVQYRHKKQTPFELLQGEEI
ncbi:MAG: class I SAM-dependent methyltransferase, partial [Proteobacteria bacterium]|nr:class I SAM-dependent methyltransferase [Pseudomonadota bacterium]